MLVYAKVINDEIKLIMVQSIPNIKYGMDTCIYSSIFGLHKYRSSWVCSASVKDVKNHMNSQYGVHYSRLFSCETDIS